MLLPYVVVITTTKVNYLVEEVMVDGISGNGCSFLKIIEYQFLSNMDRHDYIIPIDNGGWLDTFALLLLILCKFLCLIMINYFGSTL